MTKRVAPPSGWPPPVEATLDGERVALESLAAEVADRYFARFPGDLERYEPDVVRAWALHDTQHLLNWAIGDVEGFVELEQQVLWLARVLAARDFPLEQLAVNLELCADVIGHAAVAERLRGAAAAVRRTRAGGPTEESPGPG